ncbi:hypothetical protein RNAN_0607 [Rheinheimera nanhaiensis E407-8]|uniref:Uncharacterized protein n=1 Tax=Rheinheimera nanhaiensis E407-8 TaxID=562729 RepID=I1DUB0_9GAMM|nr:hypothetical protein RNAN_0607 [Rheinheimera nanhaiensis E407-8]
MPKLNLLNLLAKLSLALEFMLSADSFSVRCRAADNYC